MLSDAAADPPNYDRTISARGPMGCPHAPIAVENSARQHHVTTPTRAPSHIHFRSAYFQGWIESPIAIEYLDDFYEIIEDPGKVRSRIERDCRRT